MSTWAARWWVGFILILLPALSWAQLTYSTLVDADNDTATGCTVTLPAAGTVTGVERRLTATVSNTATPQVTGLALENCAGTGFDAPLALPGTPYPVGLNNGVNGADVIEQGVDADAIAAPGTAVRLYFAARLAGSDDLLPDAGGGALVFILLGEPVPIPTLTTWGLLLVVLVLAVLGSRRLRHAGRPLSTLLLVVMTSLALAAALDGAIDDWDGKAPIASDPQGDSASPATDLLVAFADVVDGILFLRLDVVDAQSTTSTNRPPVFTSTAPTTASVGAVYTYNITTSDPDGHALTLTAPTLPAWLTFTPGANGTGTLSGTPTAADVGGHPVSLRVTDDGTPNLSANQTFTLTVSSVPPTNRPPVFTSTAPTSATVGSAYNYAITTSDPDGHALTLTAPTLPAWLTFTPGANGTGTLSGTPTAADVGGHPVALRVTDNGSPNLSANQTFTITVGSVGNDAPTAAPQTLSTPEDTALTITLTGSDPNNDPLTFALAGNPANGTLSAITPLNATSARVIYTPNPNFTGSDRFTFTVNDGVVDSAAATVSISVGGSNDPPTANPLAQTTQEDTPITVTLSGSDPDGDPLGFTIVGSPTSGTLGAITPINDTSARVTYTPDLNFTGSDTFTFQVDDGNGGTATALVTITIDPFNDNPVANAQMLNTNEDIDLPIGLSGSDPDGDPLSFSIITPPGNGTLGTITPINATSAGITYTPAPNFTGSDSFTFQVDDGNGGTATALVEITVNPQADTPVANAQMLTVNEDTALPILLTGSDPDGDPLTFSIITPPSFGAFTQPLTQVPPTSATLEYTPAADFTGTDSFVFQVDDGTGGTATATVEITVNPINDEPTLDAIPVPAAILEDAGLQTINLSGIDAGGGETQTLTVTATSDNTALIPNPITVTYTSANNTGSLAYTPVANQSGSAVITVTVMDDGGTANPGDDDQVGRTFTVTVTPVNDEPSFTASDPPAVNENAGAQTVSNWATFDPGNPQESTQTVLAYTVSNVISTPPGLLPVTPSVDTGGTLSYTPAPGASGTATFDVTVQDDGGTADGGVDTSVAQTFTITVNAVDDPPTAVNDAETVAEDSSATAIDVLANDTDPDGGPISIVSVTQPANGTVVITGGGTGLTYQPNADYCNNPPGTTLDTFTYTLAPGSSTATVTVTVTCVNDEPTLDLDADDNQGTSGSDFAVTFTEGDPATLIEDPTDATVTDVDNTTLASLTVTLTNLLDTGAEILAADVTGTSITANYVAATGELTLTGPDTVANFQTVLRTVTYINTSPNPNTTARVIQFVANDGTANSAVATSTVTVNSVNSAPVVNGATFTLAENSANGTAVGTVTFTDPDTGQTHTFAITGGNTSGAFAIDANTGQITVANSTAVDFETTPSFSLTVQVTDNGTPAESATATVTVTIIEVNEPPVVNPATFSLAENSANGTAVGTVTFTDPDTGQTHTFAITGGNTGGAFAINPTTGAITVANSTVLNFEATPSFNLTVQVTDNRTPAESGTTTVTVNLTNVDEPPVANPQSATTFEDIPVAITLTGTDPENQTLIFNPTTPSQGMLSGTAPNLTYTPNANFSGSDSFTFTVSDGTTTSAPATVTITITAVDDPPVAVNDNASVNEDSGATAIGVLANDTDVDGGPISVASVTQPANGTVVITGGGTGLTYQPNANYCNAPPGTALDTFTYTLAPGGSSATVSVTVNCLNDPPTVAPPAAYAAQAHIGISIPDGATDLLDGSSITDVDGVGAAPFSLTAGGFTSTNGGTATVNANGSFTYDPPVGFTGNDTFTYQICDSGVPAPSACANATATVTVSGPRVWFVNNAGAAGDGRLSAPFNTLAAADTAANVNGDRIFVFTGGSTYTGGFTLQDSQRLIGQGVADTSFDVALGITSPATSVARPTINGTRPTIAGTIALAPNVTARGFNVNNTTANGVTGSGATGLTINQVSVTTTTGVAVNLANSGGTVSFTSVSSNGATNGIVLNNTTGSFAVTGTGTAGTGGTVQGTSGDGISLINTNNVSLSFMNVQNTLGSGIFGDDLTNFSLISSLVENNGDTAGGTEGSLRFNELLGTCAITNSTIRNSIADNIRLTPASGTLTNLTVSGSTIGPGLTPPTGGGNGFAVVSSGPANTTVTITNTTFVDNFASGYLTTIGDNGTHTVTITSSIFLDNNTAIDIGNGPNSDVRSTLQNNIEIERHTANAFNLITDANGTNDADYTLTASGNVVGDGTPDSGSQNSFGIAVDVRGDADAVMTITNNTVSNTDIEGIFAQSRLDADADAQIGLFDLNLTNNVVNTPDDNSAFPFFSVYGTRIESRNTTNLCMNISGNDSASVGTFEHFRVRQRDTSTFRLERLTDGDGTPNELITSLPTVEAFIIGQNIGGSTADATQQTAATGYTEAANGVCRDP